MGLMMILILKLISVGSRLSSLQEHFFLVFARFLFAMKVIIAVVQLVIMNLTFCGAKLKNDGIIELIDRAGYVGEAFKVETEDGYYLTVHRVRTRNGTSAKPPLYLQHGIFTSSIDFVLTGPTKAAAYYFADNGYDVWMGNTRGSKYSMKHRNLNIESRKYWKFSWHEFGIYDLPAMIDFVLTSTGSQKLFYVGHSQGCTASVVMLSTRPEYNQKIIQVHLLAPAVFMSNVPHPLGRILGGEILSRTFDPYTHLRFAAIYDVIHQISQFLCIGSHKHGLALCTNLLRFVVGFNKRGVEFDTVISF
jgi:lysosomal acid lipase/cholesteryl ester hydrolase